LRILPLICRYSAGVHTGVGGVGEEEK
jgi:hypothetical protein